MTYNKELLARTNRMIVLKMIQDQGPINKSEIAKRAGLSIPTVMKITEHFEKEGLIRTIGKGESTGGKRPDLLEFNSDAYYVIGVDIGRRQVKAILMDLNANALEKSSCPVLEDHVEIPDIFVRDVVEQINRLITGGGVPQDKIMGIGVGMPGIIDHTQGYVRFSPDFNWTDVSLIGLLRDHLPYRIMVENANRALALGEYSYGAGKGATHMFCINLGHGIGGAIINHGELSHGACGSSGEFGHMVMDPAGPLCDCGNYGCLEAIASGNAIAKRAAAEIAASRDTALAKCVTRIEAENVFKAAKEEDPVSREIVKECISTLGFAIASVINLLDPDVIVIAGGISKSWDCYRDLLLDAVRQHKMKYSGEKARIVLNKLGDYGPAIGAAALLVQTFINNGGEL